MLSATWCRHSNWHVKTSSFIRFSEIKNAEHARFKLVPPNTNGNPQPIFVPPSEQNVTTTTQQQKLTKPKQGFAIFFCTKLLVQNPPTNKRHFFNQNIIISTRFFSTFSKQMSPLGNCAWENVPYAFLNVTSRVMTHLALWDLHPLREIPPKCVTCRLYARAMQSAILCPRSNWTLKTFSCAKLFLEKRLATNQCGCNI